MIFKQPVGGADPTSHARIGPNDGLLPRISALTADLHLGIDLSEEHGKETFPYFEVQMPVKYNSCSCLIRS